MTNAELIYTISFNKNCSYEPGVVIDLLKGITVERANQVEDLFINKIDNYGEENDGDYIDMDIYEIIRSTLDDLGIFQKFAPIGYTIYY